LEEWIGVGAGETRRAPAVGVPFAMLAQRCQHRSGIGKNPV